MRGAPVLMVGTALALAGFSCARGAANPSAASCAPVGGELAEGARAAGLAGDFNLALVATSGPMAGRSTAGALRLRSFGGTTLPAPSGMRYPLFGGTRVQLAEVGAIAPGDVRRDDPAAPGVLVIEWDRPGAPTRTAVTLRMGAEANQGDRLRFDGPRMALFVTSISPDRFAGRWESGGGDVRAGGHFCADRARA